MKAALFAGVFLATQALVLANDPAYSALRVVGKTRGEDVLKHVIELRGKGGVPQPPTWKIVLDDPHARGGIREIEVEHGKIVAERTPISHDQESPMTLAQLNLDSEGAFTVANQQAQKRNMGFDHVDYRLRSGGGNGSPVWELDLSDGKTGHVGSIVISAESGNIIHQDFGRGHSGPPQDDHAYVDSRNNNPPPPPPPGPGPGPSQAPYDADSAYAGQPEEHEHIHDLPSFFRRVEKHFEKRGQQLQNFFSGKKSDAPPPDDR